MEVLISWRRRCFLTLRLISTVKGRAPHKARVFRFAFSIQTLILVSILLSFGHSSQAAGKFSPELAVWRIHNENHSYQGTAFAVGPNRFITVAHVIKGIRDAGQKKIILSWKETKIRLDWSKLIAISMSYDLALFETHQSVKEYLDLADEFDMASARGLYTVGYPKGSFQEVGQTGPIVQSDASSYAISVRGEVRPGASGSPVLNGGREVVGVVESAFDNRNIAIAVRLKYVRLIREEKLGSICGIASLSECVDYEVNRLKRLAEKGGKLAQYRLAQSYLHNSSNPGLSLDEALDWLRRSAEQGLARAFFHLGVIYKGVEERVTPDLVESAKWYHRGAQLGDFLAQYEVFILYEKGLGEASSFLSEEEALDALRESADAGLAVAQYSLGVLYYWGSLGLNENMSLSEHWFRKAASNGHEAAQEALDQYF